MIKQNLSGVTLIDKKGVRVNPNIHLGESDGYISGDILDANAVQGTVNEAVLTAKEDIEDLITDLIGSAPEVLDTLAELADAIGDDPDFFNTINNELDQKVDKVSGKGLSTNDYTTEEKNKLAGILAGAQVNPTNVSAFVNDAGYLTQHQDISGKENVTTIVAPVNATDATLPVTSLTTEVSKYYRLDVPVETLAVTLPAMNAVTSVKKVGIYFTAGNTPAVTITAADGRIVAFQEDYEIEAGKTYKIDALFDGSAWVVTMVEIFVPEPPMNIITYEASAKLAETTDYYSNGLHTNAFNTTIKSHTFENGVGIIEFDSDVTSIGGGAFYNCYNLTSITIPDSVTSIGQSAFSNCSGLTSVTIGSGVTSIGNSAFSNCSGLTSIDIPNSVTSIGSNAFHQCTGLTSITIPNSVTSIGSYAFDSCTDLTSITIGSGVTSIGYNAFQSCSGLTSITIPNGVTGIGEQAFYNCTGLTSVTIGSGVTSIGKSAFSGCRSLTSCTMGSGVTSIGGYVFNECSSLTSITIPDSVTSIGYGAFQSCTSLTNIVVDSANTVYDSRDNCNAIINASTNELIAGCKNTVIPNTVTSIGNSAFSNCTGLTSIEIPDSVTSIGTSAFVNCSNLTSITCNATTAPTIQNNTFRNVKTGGTLTVPSGSSGYDVWMGTGNYYLGKYNWTKVEQ